MKINRDRLKKDMIKFGEIGKDPGGGITRLPFSKEYNQAARLYKELLEEEGLDTVIDPVGNVVGTREGKQNQKALAVGSHLDTVIQGGLFDGALGCLAGLEIVRTLNENEIKTNHPLWIIGFSAEEGGKWGGTFGSRAMMGLLDYEDPKFISHLKELGLSMEDLKECRIGLDDVKSFIEMHIEQGNRLSSKNIPIGLVEGIVGITRYQVTVLGESNHAGTTPMADRKDAFQSFAVFAQEVNQRLIKRNDHLVGTFGVVEIHPNMANIIPGRVEAVIELRHMEQKAIDDFLSQIKEITTEISTAEFHFEKLVKKQASFCDEGLLKTLKESCRKKKIPFEVLSSGAGHDANTVGKKIPSAMIFVPSKQGKSHVPEEWTDWEDIQTGTEVLLEALMEIDRQS